MLTLSCGYDFDTNVQLEVRNDIMKFINSIMRNDDMVQYLLKVLAYVLGGNKYLEMVVFLIGTGRNGKGVLVSLLSKTLGDYAYEPDISFLTSVQKTSSTATPERAKAKGKRGVFCGEPEDESKIQVGSIKAMSGNDKIQARELFKSNFSYLPQFQIFASMNNPIRLNTFDDGICQRLKNIEFPYKFVDEPTLPHERKIDRTYKSKFSDDIVYRQQFMLLLTEYHSKFILGNKVISIPQDVQRFTQEYLDENNIVKKFMNETYETGTNTDKIPYNSVYTEFHKTNNKNRAWFSQQLKNNGYEIKEITRTKYIMGIKEIQVPLLSDEN
jgi:putative DNA primase/helicase